MMTPAETKRFGYINMMMRGINDKVAAIYEGLADNEVETTLEIIDSLSIQLEELRDDLKD